ncbi:hypothetical protein CPB83DRAFT_846379 [Crepidotus variabilis]|uniref:Uncharacterized protein n=1 Tax=Crepidotus variabilis TaxID=179855 RepID=A0A9P6EQF2_9AGAR|nr:hypothetical protein CPB83DRAFT_846379 [Crepidotus variabilis]
MVQFTNAILVATLAAVPILAAPFPGMKPVNHVHEHIVAREPGMRMEPKAYGSHIHNHGAYARPYHHPGHGSRIQAREPYMATPGQGGRHHHPHGPKVYAREPEPFQSHAGSAGHTAGGPKIHAREPRGRRLSVGRVVSHAGRFAGSFASAYGRDLEDNLEVREALYDELN